MFAILKDERAGAFADHEAITGTIERSRGKRGRLVLGTRREKRIKDEGVGGREFLGAAGDHHRLATAANRLIGVADGVARRGTGATGRYNATFQLEVQGDVNRRRMAHRLQVTRRGDTLGRTR